jgi:SAM-dependent methyltransferase
MREELFGSSAWEPLARALVDYQAGDETATLRVWSDLGELDPMPVSLFFRDVEGLLPADRAALAFVRGRILDVGAGVGALTLFLQGRGLEVTAVEVIPEAVEIMKARGVTDAREGRVEDLHEDGAYDTLLLLMNGTSLAGTFAGFPYLLRALAPLLAPGGQVLMDSTDVAPEEGRGQQGHGGAHRGDEEGEDDDGYPGELQYQLEYQGVRGAPFPQLFLDSGTLLRVAEEEGWDGEVVWRGENGVYLARLSRPSPEHS